MEFTSLLDTSLNLNIKTVKFLDEAPPVKGELESKFMGPRRTLTVNEEERDALIEELNRVSSENKKLTELLTVVCENYNELRNQLMKQTSKNHGVENSISAASRKRKGENSINNNNTDGNNIGPSDCSSSDEDSCKKPREEHIRAKISRVYVRTDPSDTTLIVKDGYQWRKYGQKVTRDNPCPRAYFKCSFAPTCPVKKKVQRSIEDQSVVVSTYEGEHNHPQPPKLETSNGVNRSSTPGTASALTPLSSSAPKPKLNQEETTSPSGMGTSELQQYFVEQMATALTNDPNFKTALATAITGKFLQRNNHTEKW